MAAAPCRSIVLVVAGILLVTLLGACGEDEDGGAAPRNDHSAALAPNLFLDLPVSDDARECVAAEFVEALGGTDAFEDAGVTPDELGRAIDLTELRIDVDRDEAEQVADALEPCGVSPVELLLAGLDLPADVARCVEDNVDEADLRRFIVRTIVDDGTAVEDDRELTEPLLVCFPE